MAQELRLDPIATALGNQMLRALMLEQEREDLIAEVLRLRAQVTDLSPTPDEPTDLPAEGVAVQNGHGRKTSELEQKAGRAAGAA